MREVKSTCCYCGVGCGVLIAEQDGSITGVRGDPDHPANFGRLCGKGQTLHQTVGGHGRALYPQMRVNRAEPRQRVSWDTAYEHVAARFADIITKHGPDAVAFYASGQLLTEDYYAFNKLARALVGTNNIDSNSRLCMSSAVAGYTMTLGADGPPTCYEDIDHADCILIAGSNTAWAHPVLFRRIEDAKAKRPELKIIVIDPRRTATAEIADLHLAIEPGSDVALFNGMLNVLMQEELTASEFIAAHTEGFAALETLARDYSPQVTARMCGISEEDVIAAARLFGRAKAALSLYCMGLNQSTSGAEKNAALINLHLATGHIGRVGAGPFSLTGQPNAMGGREVGAMANLLIAQRNLSSAEDRSEVARLWGVPSIPQHAGKTAVEMFDAIGRGEIKAVWIACTNPAQSMPDQGAVRAALERAELVVLQETYADTETAPYADVLLPASGWGEKEGTVTNSERRISRVRAVVAAPGEARADWRIASEFATRLEAKLESRTRNLFAFESPEDIFNEYRGMTRGRNTDITGLSYDMLERDGPRQWPLRAGATNGIARLYTDGVFPTPNGRARFVAAACKPVAENIDAQYPFRLITGRLRDQWHGMTRTGRVPQLWGHAPEPTVTLHPDDCARHGLVQGDIVHIESRRGALKLAVAANDGVNPGQAFVAMHWGSRFVSGEGVNVLTLPAFDPRSRQPELKHCAVRITRADLPWRLIAFGTLGDTMALHGALQDLLARFAFASCTLTGGREGVVFRAADKTAPPPDVIEKLHELFALDGEHVLHYEDRRRGVSRRVRLDGAHIGAACLAGDTVGSAWLLEHFVHLEPAAALGPMLLVPSERSPSRVVARGRTVCSCLSVGEAEIIRHLQNCAGSAAARLSSLQNGLHCGTSCGSCVPELKRLVSASVAAA